MLLIHRKQNEKGLSLGPFGVGINRETFGLVRILFFLYDLQLQMKLLVYVNFTFIHLKRISHFLVGK